MARRLERRLPLAAALAAWAVAGPCLAQMPLTAASAERDATAAGTAEERALDAMERLREEIRTLAALRDAQAALLAWNRGRAKAGRAPAALPAALCRDAAMKAWCALLPATFAGGGRGGQAHDGD